MNTEIITPTCFDNKKILTLQTTANFGNIKDFTNQQKLWNLLHKNQNLSEIEIHFVKQIHGDAIFEINSKTANKINNLATADAILTSQKNTACCIMTADCLPILICDKNATLVSAVHCGWKSLQKGILSKVLQKFFVKNIAANEIVIWFGACIQQCCFEVADDVLNAFVSTNLQNKNAFMAIKNNTKYLANLQQLAKNELLANNILLNNIYASNDCTFCQKNNKNNESNENNNNNYKYFSYRRNKDFAGRMVTVIMKI